MTLQCILSVNVDFSTFFGISDSSVHTWCEFDLSISCSVSETTVYTRCEFDLAMSCSINDTTVLLGVNLNFPCLVPLMTL